MTERIRRLREIIQKKEHHHFRRQNLVFSQKEKAGTPESALEGFAWVLQQEQPVFLEEERIVLTRTVPVTPSLSGLWNDCLDYGGVIEQGLDARRKLACEALEKNKKKGDLQAVREMACVLKTVKAIYSFTDRYAQAALKSGNAELEGLFEGIPRRGAKSFREAVQFYRLLNFLVKADNKDISPLGRLDQILWPYLKQDLESGKETEASAFDLLEELFLAFNRDADLYGGVQQGDNGQSIVLGGICSNGQDSWNPLSDLCLQASEELEMIDPKINMRVCSATPLERLVRATHLTAKGLGFPQYSNDDAVIPALLDMGYRSEDAYGYVVAACWEFIIAGTGLELVNVDAMNFAKETAEAVMSHLAECTTMDQLKELVRARIEARVEELDRTTHQLAACCVPSPLHTLLSRQGLIEGKDISRCPFYRNAGFHGPGLSVAADSLAAVQHFVFDTKEVSAKTLLKALNDDFSGFETLQKKLKQEGPKMGRDGKLADEMGQWLLDCFSQACEKHKTPGGGCYRAGTGSAFFHTLQTEHLPAMADGRNSGLPLPANFSPDMDAGDMDPVRIVKAFAGIHLHKAMNGGPLTMELHNTVFRNEDGIHKVALLVQLFIKLGGHQLQLNAVNRQTLLAAQQHPEQYRGLIVRVWGWSGYFVELDPCYQDQILRRMELEFS